MRLLLNGTLPTKEQLANDELIAQMLTEAEAKGAASVPGKDAIIQALTVAEIPDAIKQSLIPKDVPTKETVLQALTVEDIPAIPEAVVQKIVEDKGQLAPFAEKFAKTVVQAMGSDKGHVNDDKKGGAEKSILAQYEEARRQVRI